MDKNPIHIPELEPHCGSWVAVRKTDGTPIGEFYERESLVRFNPATVEIKTAAQHLGELNRRARVTTPERIAA